MRKPERWEHRNNYVRLQGPRLHQGNNEGTYTKSSLSRGKRRYRRIHSWSRTGLCDTESIITLV
jgi:hypothetical protein